MCDFLKTKKHYLDSVSSSILSITFSQGTTFYSCVHALFKFHKLSPGEVAVPAGECIEGQFLTDKDYLGKVEGQLLHISRWLLQSPVVDAEPLLRCGRVKVWAEGGWETAHSCLLPLWLYQFMPPSLKHPSDLSQW